MVCKLPQESDWRRASYSCRFDINDEYVSVAFQKKKKKRGRGGKKGKEGDFFFLKKKNNLKKSQAEKDVGCK